MCDMFTPGPEQDASYSHLEPVILLAVQVLLLLLLSQCAPVGLCER